METSLQPLAGDGRQRKDLVAGGAVATYGKGSSPVLLPSAGAHSITPGAGHSGGCCRLMGSAPRYRSPRVSPGSEGVPSSANPEAPRFTPADTGPSMRASCSWISSMPCGRGHSAQPR